MFNQATAAPDTRRIVKDERPKITLSRAAQLANTTPNQIYKYAIPGMLFEYDKTKNTYTMFKSDLPDLVALLKDKAPGDVHVVLEGAEMITIKDIADKLNVKPFILYNLRTRGQWPKEYQGFLTLAGGHGQGRRRQQVLKFDASVVPVLRDLLDSPKPQQERTTMLTNKDIAEALGVQLYRIHHLKSYGEWPKGFEGTRTAKGYVYPEGVVEAVRPLLEGIYKGRGKEKQEPVPQTPVIPDHSVVVPLLKSRDAPVAVPNGYLKSIAIDLIQNGFTDAGVWLLTTKL